MFSGCYRALETQIFKEQFREKQGERETKHRIMKKNILELRSGKLFRGPVKSEVFFSCHLSGSPDLRQARFTMTEDLR